MEITSVLKRESSDRIKAVKKIKYKGERLDLSRVRKWRNKILSSDGRGQSISSLTWTIEARGVYLKVEDPAPLGHVIKK